MFKQSEGSLSISEHSEFVSEFMGNGELKRYLKGRSLGKVPVL